MYIKRTPLLVGLKNEEGAFALATRTLIRYELN